MPDVSYNRFAIDTAQRIFAKAMSRSGYIIRREHVQTALDKATAAEAPHLERCLEMVSELDALERSLRDRVRQARVDAGIETPPLSRAAKEAVAQSEDASRDVDRILTRKCNRADSAQAVVKEILSMARGDLKAANVLDNDTPEDDPTKPIYSELYWKKRSFVASLREFLADDASAPPG